MAILMDNKKKRNAIFLLIDGLRYDTLNNNKFSEYLFPNLSKLKKNSTFSPCISNGISTQMALPSIFSLTYPLDYGGYENGLRERPKTFIESFKEQGYNTHLLSNCPEIATSYDHYHRGFDNIKSAHDFRNIIEIKLNRTIKPKFLKIINSEKSDHEGFNYLKKEMKLLFQSLIKSFELENKFWPDKLFKINKKIVKGFQQELALLEKNPSEIKKKILENVPRNYWFSFGYSKFLGKKKPNKYRFYLIKMFHISHFKLRQLIRKTRLFPFIFNFNMTVVKADRLLPELKKIFISSHEPWMVYCHLMDLHGIQEIYDIKDFINKILVSPKWLLAKLKGYTKRRFTYDASLILLDKKIGPILSYIMQNKKLSETVIIVTGDHGNSKAYSPKRKKGEKDYFLGLYEESLKVPAVIYDKDNIIKKECLIDSMGVTATLLKTLSIPFHESYKGISLNSGGRSIVISEHTGRGLPDLINKALYFVLTSKNEKLFVCIKEQELILRYHDLVFDPFEEENLIEKNEYRGRIINMLKYLVKERKEVIFDRFTKAKCKKFDFEISEIM